MKRSAAAAAALCTGWLVFAVHPAAAQTPSPAQHPPSGQERSTSTKLPPTAKVSDQQVDKTAAAIKNLRGVRTEYAQKLATAKPEEQNKVASEGNAAMKKAVNDQGLSVEEYNSIVRLAQNDPDVRAKIEARLGGER